MSIVALSLMKLMVVVFAAPAGSGAAQKCAEAPARIASMANVSLAQGERLTKQARERGLGLVMRPVGSGAPGRRDEGCSPKPEAIKWKTCNKYDLLLGAPEDCLSLLVLFEPKEPKEWPTNPQQKKALKNRLVQRQAEWKYAHHEDAVEWFGDTVYVYRDKECKKAPSPKPLGCLVGYREADGFVRDIKNRKPFTGDLDLFDVISANGEGLASNDEDKKKFINDLVADKAVDVLHPAHMDWDTSKKNGVEATPEEKAKNDVIRARIIDGHREKPVKEAVGEPLVVLLPDCTVCKTWNQPAGQTGRWDYPCMADMKYAVGSKLYIKSSAATPDSQCFAITITKAARHGLTGSYEFKNAGGGVSGDDSARLEGRVCAGAPVKQERELLKVKQSLRIKGGPSAPDSDCYTIEITKVVAYEDGSAAYEFKNEGGGVSGDDAASLAARTCK